MSNDLATLKQPESQHAALVGKITELTVITCQSELERMVELCREGKDRIAQIKAHYEPMKKKAHEAHKTVCNEETKMLDNLPDAVNAGQKAADAYLTSERNRLQAIEDARVKKERADAEALRREQEEAALKRATELEKQGRPDLAEKVMETAATIAETPILAPEPVKVEIPKTAGVAQRTVWDFEVIDKALVPDQYKTLNETLIKAMIKSNEIPGIRRFQRQATSLRG